MLSTEHIVPTPTNPSRQTPLHGAVFSLVSTIIGGGILSLPYTFAQAGLFWGPVTLLFVATASDFSFYLLILCSRKTGLTTYEEIAYQALGRHVQAITLVLLFLLLILSCVAYVCLLRDLLSPLIECIFNITVTRPWRWAVMGVCMVCVFPVCLMKNIQGLRWNSLFSLISIIVLAIAIALRSIQFRFLGIVEHSSQELIENSGTLKIFSGVTLADLVYSTPIVSVAYLCHFNVLPVHGNLTAPTWRRVYLLCHIVIIVVSVLYMEVGVFGYMYAGELTQGNILNNFLANDPVITVGRAALACTVTLNFPMLVIPTRLAAERLVGLIMDQIYIQRKASLASLHSGNERGSAEEKDEVGEDQPLLKALEWETVDQAIIHLPPVSPTMHFVETLIIVAIAYACGLVVQSIATIWSVMGSTVSIVIAYVLPACFYLRIIPNKGRLGERIGAWVLLIVGTVMFFVCSWQALARLGFHQKITQP